MTVLSAPTANADLAGLVEEIWAGFVGVDHPLERVAAPPAAWVGQPWSGTVTIDGGWCGLVRVELDHPIALVLTSRMSGPAGPAGGPDGPTHDDITDAVGRLTNVVGGNVKSLSGEGRLSLPAVGRPLPRHAELAVACRCDHLWDGYRLAVSVLIIPTVPGDPSPQTSPQAR
jgi:chemotaxis protein CheX